MKNEFLCRILCHNIVCLVSAFYELGIDADFGKAASCRRAKQIAQVNNLTAYSAIEGPVRT